MRTRWVSRSLVAVAAAVGVVAATAPAAPASPAAAAQAVPGAPTSVVVSQTTGLVDGDEVSVTVDGSADDTFWISQCEGDLVPGAPVPEMLDACGSEWAVVPGPRPAVEPFTVRHRFQTGTGRYVVCDDPPGCAIGVSGQRGEGLILTPVEVAPGPPGLRVSPSWGLTDVQDVGVSASPLPLSYAGSPFWVFPTTGNWLLAQCVAPLAAQPTILDVFNRCAAVPGGGAVEVGDPYADLGAVTVTADITPVLGPPTSCRPEACVLAAVRVESSGTVTAVSSALGFA
jgi:hypothetical protein